MKITFILSALLLPLSVVAIFRTVVAALNGFYFLYWNYTYTHGTHSEPIVCKHTKSVSTQYFSPRISFFIFLLQLLLLDDGLNVCACNSIRWIDSTQKRKKSDDDDAGTKKIELNWNWSAHIIMYAYRRHRGTIVRERERSECVYFATHTKCIGGV